MTPPPSVALLHYTAPPIVGGVEAVINAHARLLVQAGYDVTVIAGRGAADALPAGAQFKLIPELDTRQPQAASQSTALEKGVIPSNFNAVVVHMARTLLPILDGFDHVIVHNIFTKHFHLPFTAALWQLLDAHHLQHVIAWCHDFTWTSDHSRSTVHSGYPWDLLRTRRLDLDYVVVSQERQQALAQLFNCSPNMIQVIYNGVDPDVLLGLSAKGRALIDRLELPNSALILLMPVRITEAKNIELALRVTAALKARECQPRLIVTGPPDPHDTQNMAYFQSLRTLRARLDLERDVRFVFESGIDSDEGYAIDDWLVAELIRISDMVFLPSHREGFGMPVLEAGLAGVPVVCTGVPAAYEIGGGDVLRFDAADSPDTIADLMWAWAQHSRVQRLRRRVRRAYTWQAIFQRDILPLLHAKEIV